MSWWTPIWLLTVCVAVAWADKCSGCLSLDEHNFDKVVKRFGVSLVKFDVAFPYGEKHEAFETIAGEMVDSKDVILAQVGLKDYGDKENEELAKKYAVTKDDLPALRLFIEGKEHKARLNKDDDWTADSLRRFLKTNTNVYIGLPGCVEELDKIANNFAGAGDKAGLIKTAEKSVEKLQDEEQKSGKVYVKFMKKIVENGLQFIGNEDKRLNKIIKDGKLTDAKKKQLNINMNILKSFKLPKDEL